VNIIVRCTNKIIVVQEMSEGERRHQYGNSSEDVQDSHDRFRSGIVSSYAGQFHTDSAMLQ
jgi:hypothetical protein